MNRLTLLALLTLSACPTQAPAETWAVATVNSYHFKDSGNNEANFGVGFERGIAERLSLMAGEYRNSMGRTSVYAGLAWTPLSYGSLHFGFAAGAISGYESRPVPMVVPMVSMERQRYGANVFVTPNANGSSGAIGFQIKAKF